MCEKFRMFIELIVRKNLMLINTFNVNKLKYNNIITNSAQIKINIGNYIGILRDSSFIINFTH